MAVIVGLVVGVGVAMAGIVSLSLSLSSPHNLGGCGVAMRIWDRIWWW